MFPFLRSIARFLNRLFFLDLWRHATTRPVLLYAAVIIFMGTFIFHWLEGWSYLDSVYFVVITLTTIGFGDYLPTTPLSKVLTIFFGINGIALLLVLFDLIRRVRGFEASPPPTMMHTGSVQKNSPRQYRRFRPIRLLLTMLEKLFLIDLIKDKHSQAVLLYAGGTIVVGAIAFHYVENWSFLDSVYFMVMTMTTIGYGDITPQLPWGKILTIFFGLNGIVVLLSLYDRIRAVRGQNALSRIP